jgi:hypothetical protein
MITMARTQQALLVAALAMAASAAACSGTNTSGVGSPESGPPSTQPDGSRAPGRDGGAAPDSHRVYGKDAGAAPDTYRAPGKDSSVPVACGAAGEPCCTGSKCSLPALTCSNGVCSKPAAGDTGKACTKNGQCPSGICLPIGNGTDVCTTTCATVADCVAGWTCGPLVGQTSDVCKCTYSPQTCDGKDDDCDGTVDDEPAADEWCASKMGTGAVCAGGSCDCGGALTLCGSQCVDTKTDSDNCGGCAGQGGVACATGQSCVGGSCSCPASTPTFCSTTKTCVDTKTDPSNCGACAKACPTGATCAGGACACPTGQVVCGKTCSDTQTDPKNCGGCGLACPAGQTCSQTSYGVVQCCSNGTDCCSIGGQSCTYNGYLTLDACCNSGAGTGCSGVCGDPSGAKCNVNSQCFSGKCDAGACT